MNAKRWVLFFLEREKGREGAPGMLLKHCFDHLPYVGGSCFMNISSKRFADRRV